MGRLLPPVRLKRLKIPSIVCEPEVSGSFFESILEGIESLGPPSEKAWEIFLATKTWNEKPKEKPKLAFVCVSRDGRCSRSLAQR